jgi:hypothetical protein
MGRREHKDEEIEIYTGTKHVRQVSRTQLATLEISPTPYYHCLGCLGT